MISRRRMRQTVFGAVASAFVFTSSIVGVYKTYIDFVRPYKILHVNNSYYLKNKTNDEKKVITDSFELGTLEERLRGLAKEPAKALIQTIDDIKTYK